MSHLRVAIVPDCWFLHQMLGNAVTRTPHGHGVNHSRLQVLLTYFLYAHVRLGKMMQVCYTVMHVYLMECSQWLLAFNTAGQKL
jgi:hypothetical protein